MREENPTHADVRRGGGSYLRTFLATNTIKKRKFTRNILRTDDITVNCDNKQLLKVSAVAKFAIYV